MCSVKLTSCIKSTSRINLPIIQKTPRARESYANYLSEQFQELLLKNKNKKITQKEYRDYVFKVTKTNNLNIKITNLENSDKKAMISSVINLYHWTDKPNDYFADYLGYNLEVKKDKGKLDCAHTTLVHETRHLFDMLCNPKYKMARHYKDFNNKELMEQYSDIKRFITEPDLYKPEQIFGIKFSTFEKQLRKKLWGLKNTEAIDILQISRYHLKSERNAYIDSANYELKKYDFSMNILLAYLKLRKDINDRFHFLEKEKVLNKLLKEYISNERLLKTT